jgi:hypothetical protein
MAATYVKGFAIKNQWMNLSLYFINFMYKTKKNPNRNKVCGYENNDFWIVNENTLKDNNNPIGGKEKNNKWLAYGEKIQTCFIEVDKEDLVKFFGKPELGFRFNKSDLKGSGYARAENNSTSSNNLTNQERENDISTSTIWNDTVLKPYYFLKGANNNDIFQYLVNSKVI